MYVNQETPRDCIKKPERARSLTSPEISQPYEMPANPEIIIETDRLGIEESVENIIAYLTEKKII